MSLLNECPLCGAALDPGERCDCEAENKNGVPDQHIEDARCNGKLSTAHATSSLYQKKGKLSR